MPHFVLCHTGAVSDRIMEMVKCRTPHKLELLRTREPRLSALADLDMDSWKLPVLVKIEIDTAPPTRAIIIDHRGEHKDKPSALLQVLELLKIEPTRYDILLASYDKDGIMGLLAARATPEEVALVLQADRYTEITLKTAKTFLSLAVLVKHGTPLLEEMEGNPLPEELTRMLHACAESPTFNKREEVRVTAG